MMIDNKKTSSGYRVRIKDPNTGDQYFGEITKAPGERKAEAIRGFITIMKETARRYQESIKQLEQTLHEVQSTN